MKLYYKNLCLEKLIRLGYTYDITEGGYISKDRCAIIIDNRSPYNGQILNFSKDEQKHHDNLQKLFESGALIIIIKPETNRNIKTDCLYCLEEFTFNTDDIDDMGWVSCPKCGGKHETKGFI